MTYSGSPVIAGITLPKPNGASDTDAPVRSGVTLAAGGTRAFNNGVRRSFELSWSRMTEGDLATLRAAVRSAYVPYTHLDGLTYVVETGDVKADAIAGTDPTRFAVSTTLTQQTPTR